MAKAKKLKSGSWRCLVYDYTDADGKRHYESFTAGTKKEAEFLAAEFLNNKDKTDRPKKEKDYTVIKALEEYCEIKNNVLSPATIRGYKGMINIYFDEIKSLKLSELTNAKIQKWINNLSKDKSPKTISNVYGLLSSAISMFCPDAVYHVKLPQKVIYSSYVPSDCDIKALIDYFSASNKDMLISVYMAAFGTMRRSEICALTAGDVSGNVIHVSKAIVKNSTGEFVEKKTPKTSSSNRYVEMPDFVIDILPKSGKLVNINPNQITSQFSRTIKKIGIPSFRFHDLRHYAASIMHAIGIPDVYIMQRGGWSSDSTLKRIYRGSIEDYQRQYTKDILTHYEGMQHEIQHGFKKPLKNQGL